LLLKRVNDMVLTIGKIPDGRSVLSQKVEVEEDRAEWIPLIGDLLCRAEIDRIQTRISVHMFYEGKTELECSRCLRKIEYPIRGECFVLLKNSSTEKKRPAVHQEISYEECDFTYNDSTDEIDIRSAIFDEILLSLPLKPLCSEACPGIPRKSETETIVEKPKTTNSDPRWENLKKIRFSSGAPRHTSGAENSKV
jgi:uncharacterized protein